MYIGVLLGDEMCIFPGRIGLVLGYPLSIVLPSQALCLIIGGGRARWTFWLDHNKMFSTMFQCMY